MANASLPQWPDFISCPAFLTGGPTDFHGHGTGMIAAVLPSVEEWMRSECSLLAMDPSYDTRGE
jgi:hypothetical protein